MSNKSRLLEIVSVLKKYDIFKNCTPVNLRCAFEELGPAFVKIGQILSNRRDLISDKYIDELSKLRYDVKPMSFDEVKEILDFEYDGKTDEIFTSIDSKPLGSASIASVHKATLHGGREVVVKVQRKNIKETFVGDIKLLKKVTKMFRLEKFLNGIVSFDDILDELLQTTLEEMDFVVEADHIEEFYNCNKDIPFIKVPKVIRKYSTSQVLVMDYIRGNNLNEVEALEKAGYDLEEIGSKLADHFIYQALDTGYFHADLHPNNIIISGDKIAYIDYGMMGRITSRNMDLLKRCMVAIFNQDIKEVSKIILIMCDVKGDIDNTKLCNSLELLLDKFKSTSIKDIDITKFTTDLIKLLWEFGIKVPKDVTMLIRGIVVIEGTLEVISPNISLMEVFKNKLKNTNVKSIFNKENIVKELGYFVGNVESLNRIPKEVNTTLKSINRGEVKINIELVNKNQYLDRFEKMVHRLVVGIIDVSFILSAAMLASNGVSGKNEKFMFIVFVLVAAFLTIWLFFKMYMDKLNRRKR